MVVRRLFQFFFVQTVLKQQTFFHCSDHLKNGWHFVFGCVLISISKLGFKISMLGFRTLMLEEIEGFFVATSEKKTDHLCLLSKYVRLSSEYV